MYIYLYIYIYIYIYTRNGSFARIHTQVKAEAQSIATAQGRKKLTLHSMHTAIKSWLNPKKTEKSIDTSAPHEETRVGESDQSEDPSLTTPGANLGETVLAEGINKGPGDLNKDADGQNEGADGQNKDADGQNKDADGQNKDADGLNKDQTAALGKVQDVSGKIKGMRDTVHQSSEKALANSFAGKIDKVSREADDDDESVQEKNAYQKAVELVEQVRASMCECACGRQEGV
jgi:hypothetical protein